MFLALLENYHHFCDPGEVPLQQETLIRSLKLLAPCILWDECREVGGFTKNCWFSAVVVGVYLVPLRKKNDSFVGTLKF